MSRSILLIIGAAGLVAPCFSQPLKVEGVPAFTKDELAALVRQGERLDNINTQMGQIQAQIREVKTDLKAEIKEVKTSMDTLKGDVERIKWVADIFKWGSTLLIPTVVGVVLNDVLQKRRRIKQPKDRQSSKADP